MKIFHPPVCHEFLGEIDSNQTSQKVRKNISLAVIAGRPPMESDAKEMFGEVLFAPVYCGHPFSLADFNLSEFVRKSECSPFLCFT